MRAMRAMGLGFDMCGIAVAEAWGSAYSEGLGGGGTSTVESRFGMEGMSGLVGRETLRCEIGLSLPRELRGTSTRFAAPETGPLMKGWKSRSSEEVMVSVEGNF